MIEYTDQQFLYRAVPVDYDGAAKLKRIKGNTLAFNQLVNNGNFANGTSGWNGSISSSASNNICTLTANSTSTNLNFNQMVSIPNGHTVLFKFDIKPSLNTPIMFNFYDGTNFNVTETFNATANTWYSYSKSITVTANIVQIYFRPNQTGTNGSTYQLRNVMLIDLTLMGITADQFKSYFPLPYYSYQSTLLPFKGTGIKTVGKNLMNSNDVQVGKAWNNTSNSARATTFVPVMPNTQYVISISGLGSLEATFIREESSIGVTSGIDFVLNESNKSRAFTTSSSTYYLAVQGNKTNITKEEYLELEWMLEFGSVATDYEPYTSSTTDLPTLTYFPNGMKSAGNVYDELLPTKAITRIGAVDLGSLNWAYDSSVPRFTSSDIVSAVAVPSSNSNIANIKCAVYDSISLNGLAQSNKCIAVSTGGVISAKDTAYTTAEAFKSAMSGVYLYYELKNYVETDADAEIFYRFYQYGTEQILPVNGATPTTAPIIADIEYYNQIESETPYRKFWLVNGNGERWDLTEKELKSFLENPQGLGFQKTIDVTRYGERAYKNTESYNFPQVTGDVLFYDSANSTRYEKYNEFVRFLMEQPITLHYMIPVSYNSLIADTYSLECEVMSLTKTESKTDHILTSNIQMNGLGFYEGDEIEINGTANTLTINNKGDFPVGFEIELRGTYKNPYFTLEQNGELYGEAKFDDNANNFSSVFVNSKDGEQNVVLKQNNSIMPNPLAYQDLSISNGSIYVTFVKLAKGESTLTIGADSYTISGYTIRYTPIYRSV